MGMRSQIVTASEGNDMSNEMPLQVDQIGSLIRSIRGQKVILDADLARIYNVPTKVLNQAVKRNLARFPDDFLFQLTISELDNLMRSRFMTASETPDTMRSQFVTTYKRNVRFLPYAFTENSAIMRDWFRIVAP
ncbi:MAG TPA: ORF6N domain-containing protein [Verrucomicrobiae bacterium]|nr:ORF6N domain-containing protein [Verrucomicrobiae bacterium]